MRKDNGTGRELAILLSGLGLGILASRFLPPVIASVAGSRRARAGEDPFALLIDGHREILSLLDQMVDSPTDSKWQRSRLFLMLKRKLAKHALAEEDVVYPIVHNQSTHEAKDKHLYDEHADMKILLFDIETMIKNGADWSSAVVRLRDLIRRHVNEEETEIFPRLREQLAASGSPEVSGQISREEALII